jgi:hypothetical protein
MARGPDADKVVTNRVNIVTLICALIAASASIFAAIASLCGTYATNKSNAKLADLNRELTRFQIEVMPYTEKLRNCLSEVKFAFEAVCADPEPKPSVRLVIELEKLVHLKGSTPLGWDDVKEKITHYNEFVAKSYTELLHTTATEENRKKNLEDANSQRQELLDAIEKSYQEAQRADKRG